MKARSVDLNGAIAYVSKLVDVTISSENINFSLDNGTVEPTRFTLSEAALAAYPLDQENNIGFRAIDYLSRQMGYIFCTHEQAIAYGLGYHLAKHRLMFPVRHPDGVLAGFVGRSMIGKIRGYYNYDQGFFNKSLCLIGAEGPMQRNYPLVVVEGPTSYVYLRSCGVPNVVATMGADFSIAQVRLIEGYGLDIVPLFDSDAAGMRAKYRLKRLLGEKRRILSFAYPAKAYREGKADPRQVPRDLIPVLRKSFGALNFTRL
jgi:5S rRNA maturation endonuclease (ribonuclease M5)